MKNVQFRFVESKKCSDVEKQQANIPLKPIKGTMKLHAVVGLGNSKIYTRDVSCYCENCRTGKMCDGWSLDVTRKETNEKVKGKTNANACEKTTTDSTRDEDTTLVEKAPNIDEEILHQDGNENESVVEEYVVDELVAAMYDEEWFIGQITDIDEDEYEVSFMKAKKEQFQWPIPMDKLWISKSSILSKVHTLSATGKSKRMFNIDQNEKDAFDMLKAQFLAKE